MSKKKLLITGGAGFIGGNFVQYMVDKYSDYGVINLDLLTYAGDLTKHTLIENKENYRFVQADIADREAVMNLLKKRSLILWFTLQQKAMLTVRLQIRQYLFVRM